MNYRIGDIVLIVSKKPVNCSAGWCGGMGQYLAQVATITSLHKHGPYYRIDLDDGEFWWSEDCFDGILADLPDLEVEESVDIFSLFR